MIDPKLAGIVAAFSFLLSFLLGIVNQTTFTVSLLRALIFAVIFFGIAVGVEFLYKKFLLPDEDDDTGNFEVDGYGDNVDISVGDNESELGGSNVNDILNADESINDSDDVEELEPVEDAAELETLDDAEASEVEELEPLDAADDGGLEDIESEPLDQKSKDEYYNNGGVISAKDDLDIGAFVPGLAGLDEVSNASKRQPSSSRSAKTEYDMDSGTVDMTMEKRGGKDVDFEVDGKKAAGAIQTLLSKDED